MITDAIHKVVARQNLSSAESHECFSAMMRGEVSEIQIAALLTALRAKGETSQEILGAVRAMREAAAQVNVGMLDVVDIVGTGGDGANTFNISTTAAFVIAGAGVPVAKHGNRSVTSKSGAADLLDALGFNLLVSSDRMETCIQENGIGFLFAQTLHPAMRYAAPVRKALKMRTIFNLLGPLTNPAGARHHLIGVYDSMYTEVFATVLKELGSTHALIVHSLDGLDEISGSGTTHISELRDGAVRTYEFFPEMAIQESSSMEEIHGGTPQENAEITLNILRGKEQGPKRDVVLLNAGAAIYAADASKSLQKGVEMAAESIDSGAAEEKLARLIEASK